MLENIWVNNFRSLENFSLSIQPGLNVLVGPNGAGKTSIMKWFEFIALMATSSLREAIGKIGGANHVFRRKNDKYTSMLEFSLSGTTPVRTSFYFDGDTPDETDAVMRYHYMGCISIIKNQIFFSKQETKIWLYPRASVVPPLSRSEKHQPNVEINWRYDVIEDKVTCDFNTLKPNLKLFNKLRHLRYFFDDNTYLKDFLESKSLIETFLTSNMFFPIDLLYNVKSDLSYKKAFNLNPNSVRATLDISSQSGVQFDGAGAVATLYDLRAEMENRIRYNVLRRHKTSSYPLFDRALSYFKLSDNNITNITVDIDSFRNEFTLEVEYGSDTPYRVPISLLSDGTVKWLALVTALTTEPNSLFIEEPENFLHPRLQENVVEILREEVDSGAQSRFALITTHSETLLNKLFPSEIVIVSMIDGRTLSERIDDPEEISKIISSSGFGLGYYYVAGGF